MRRRLFILVFLFVIIDQLSKWLAEDRLPFHQTVELLPFFSLYRTHNTGVAFSMLNAVGSLGLIILTLAIIAFVFYLWRRVADHKQLAHLGFAFVMAGAIGNLIDRMSQGHVIDFFLLHSTDFSWSFAVFNVADSFITIGAIAIIIDELFTSKEQSSGSTPS